MHDPDEPAVTNVSGHGETAGLLPLHDVNMPSIPQPTNMVSDLGNQMPGAYTGVIADAPGHGSAPLVVSLDRSSNL